MPKYRKIVVPIQVDMINPGMAGRQTISPLQLPDFAQDVITHDLGLRMGVGEIEQLARRGEPGDVVKLHPRGSAELVAIMNSQQSGNGRILALYWGVSPVALEGVVDKVRTTLTVMIAELNADLPDGTATPSAEATTNAINFAMSGGKRNTINLAAPQAGTSVTTTSSEEQPRRWLKITGSVLIALITIAGVIFTLMQVQGWQF